MQEALMTLETLIMLRFKAIDQAQTEAVYVDNTPAGPELRRGVVR